MDNNLFDYAAKELSQDAFLCWCLNWYNYPDAPLFPMAKELLHLLGEDAGDSGGRLIINQQIRKIDILVSLPERGRAIIIEDKTTSSEHDEQIARYRQTIEKLSLDERRTLGLEEPFSVRTVYFKTGFHYDRDRDTTADISIDAPALLNVLESYAGISGEILDAYCARLHRLSAWYDEHGRYDAPATSDEFGDRNISRHSIAQHNFMRDMLRGRFPESLWTRGSELYKIRIGTNVGGRPWTEMTILERQYPSSEDWYYLFWRVDTDKKGPYMSLRFYERYDKKNAEKLTRHVHACEHFRETVRDFVSSRPDAGLDVSGVGTGTGSCYESAIFSICLTEPLKDWTRMSETVKRQVLGITDIFCGDYRLT